MTAHKIRVYTSNVFAIGPSIWCAIGTIAISVGILSASGTPVVAALTVVFIITVLVVLFVVMTAHVGVMATHNDVAYRVGFGRWRSFSSSVVRNSECVHVGALAIIGIGVPLSRSTARHIVRAGPTLHLEIDSGEHLWLSVTAPLPEDITTDPASPISERNQPR